MQICYYYEWTKVCSEMVPSDGEWLRRSGENARPNRLDGSRVAGRGRSERANKIALRAARKNRSGGLMAIDFCSSIITESKLMSCDSAGRRIHGEKCESINNDAAARVASCVRGIVVCRRLPCGVLVAHHESALFPARQRVECGGGGRRKEFGAHERCEQIETFRPIWKIVYRKH